MFGTFDNIMQKSETSSYPSCPRHAHHTVTVRSWFHLYFQCSISEMLMSIGMPVCAFFARTAVHAETQFEKYRITQDRLFESDFDRFLELEEKRKGLARKDD